MLPFLSTVCRSKITFSPFSSLTATTPMRSRFWWCFSCSSNGKGSSYTCSSMEPPSRCQLAPFWLPSSLVTSLPSGRTSEKASKGIPSTVLDSSTVSEGWLYHVQRPNGVWSTLRYFRAESGCCN